MIWTIPWFSVDILKKTFVKKNQKFKFHKIDMEKIMTMSGVLLSMKSRIWALFTVIFKSLMRISCV